MSTRRASTITALVAGLAAGALYPLIETAISCRAPDSEACVWGKALLPLEIAVSAFVVGIPLAIVVFLALEWRRRGRGRDQARP